MHGPTNMKFRTTVHECRSFNDIVISIQSFDAEFKAWVLTRDFVQFTDAWTSTGSLERVYYS